MILSILLACAAPTGDSAAPPWAPPEGGPILLEARDGVTLAADWYPHPEQSAPAVVLVHMHPPGGWDRQSWPSGLIEGLGEAGWSVMVIDRRGAGESEGDPDEAWLGEWGRYDVEAAALRITGDGYERVAVLGASNGTTSMIDYAAWASGEGLPAPIALAYLSGGAYTETNTDLSDVPVVPSAFVYDTAEAEWPEQWTAAHPEWSHHPIPRAGHGTHMLTGRAAEEAEQVLIDFFSAQL